MKLGPQNAASAVRLNEKTAEEQNTENDDYRDDDDLDQAHNRFLMCQGPFKLTRNSRRVRRAHILVAARLICQRNERIR